MKLSEEQTEAFAYCLNFISGYNATRNPATIFADPMAKNGFLLSGYAGTGKSVIIRLLIKALEEVGIYGKVISFTGRAASHHISAGILNASTAHSLLMEPVLDSKGNLEYFRHRDKREIYEDIGGYLIVEEAGMLPKNLIDAFDQLNIPILFVGDDEQLEAINDQSIFDLVVDSDRYRSWGAYFLSEIRRTADDSPIDYLAKNIRETGRMFLDPSIDPGDAVKFEPKSKAFTGFIRDNHEKFDVIVCGTNRTRKKINEIVRRAKMCRTDIPEPGEKIICLKNNVIHNVSISNGELFEVTAVYESAKKNCHRYSIKRIGNSKVSLTVEIDDEFFSSEKAIKENQGDRELAEFTFGYAMSAHKVQGSTENSVLFYDEDVSFFLNQKKFRYTAVTRAANHVTILK